MRESINLGHGLARPFESRYATWRRCASVNPGVSRSRLYYALTGNFSGGARLQAALEDRQLAARESEIAPELAPRGSYRRQCPLCAAACFHADVYAYPWLSHCPIHHCALTEHCPRCGRDWPNASDVTKRDCPVCGRASLEQLARPIPIEACRVIGEIQSFLAPRPPLYVFRSHLSGTSDTRSAPWCEEIRTVSPAYGPWRSRNQSAMSKHELDRLHITTESSSRIICSALTRTSETDIRRHTTGLCPLPLGLEPSVSAEWNLRLESDAFSRLTRWMSEVVPGHAPRLIEVADLSADTFVKTPPACPYCLALSFWFLKTAQKHYGNAFQYYFECASHWICKTGSLFPFADFVEGGGEPLILMDDYSAYYVPDERMRSWFYSRALDLQFVVLLKRISATCLAMNHHRMSGDTSMYRRSCACPDIEADLYGIGGDFETLEIYYRNDNRLDEIDSCDLWYTARDCRDYFDYCRSDSLYSSMVFGVDSAPSDDPYQSFISNHTELQNRLRLRFRTKIEEGRSWHGFYRLVGARGPTASVDRQAT